MSGVIAFASWSASSWPTLALPLSLSSPPLPTTSSKSDTGDVCCAATANRTALLVVVPHKPASGNVGAVRDNADNTISTVLIRLPGDKGRRPKWRCAPIIVIFMHISYSLLLVRSGGPVPLVSAMVMGREVPTENKWASLLRRGFAARGRNIRGVFQRGGVIGDEKCRC